MSTTLASGNAQTDDRHAILSLGALSLTLSILAVAASVLVRVGGQHAGFSMGEINLTLKGMILLSLAGIVSAMAGFLFDEKRSAAVIGAAVSVFAVVLIPMLVG